MGIRSNTRDIVSGRYRDRTSDLCRVKAEQADTVTWHSGGVSWLDYGSPG